MINWFSFYRVEIWGSVHRRRWRPATAVEIAEFQVEILIPLLESYGWFSSKGVRRATK